MNGSHSPDSETSLPDTSARRGTQLLRGALLEEARLPAFYRSKGYKFMGLFSKDIQTMDDLLLHGLKDIYYAVTSPKG
jgi:hypothetical protein